MEPRFGRVITAMITPFAANGALELDGAVELARWLVEQGNDGLVLAGTTGESPTLTHDEQMPWSRPCPVPWIATSSPEPEATTRLLP